MNYPPPKLATLPLKNNKISAAFCYLFIFFFFYPMSTLKQLLKTKPQITLALLKPDICANAALPPKIRQAIKAKNLEIVEERDVLWTEKQAGEFYAEHQGKFFYHRLCGYMTSGPFKAMILASPNAIKDWRALIGPTHPVR